LAIKPKVTKGSEQVQCSGAVGKLLNQAKQSKQAKQTSKQANQQIGLG
jgi:hypothetical protein